MQDLRRSKQTREKKSYGNNFLICIVEDEHVSYYDVIKFVDALVWLEAFNKLLEWVESPLKVKPISCKWVFKTKLYSCKWVSKRNYNQMGS